MAKKIVLGLLVLLPTAIVGWVATEHAGVGELFFALLAIAITCGAAATVIYLENTRHRRVVPEAPHGALLQEHLVGALADVRVEFLAAAVSAFEPEVQLGMLISDRNELVRWVDDGYSGGCAARSRWDTDATEVAESGAVMTMHEVLAGATSFALKA